MNAKSLIRIPVSLMLSIAIITVFSLPSFAVTEATTVSTISSGYSGALVQGPTGIITGEGQFSINGNTAQSGATVLSGSTIATGSDGHVFIELGQLGRIEMKENTSITLVFSPGLVDIKVLCDNPAIKVMRGQANVRVPKTETIIADPDKWNKYDDPTELSTNGDTDLVIDCNAKEPAAIYWKRGGILGLLVMAGLATIIVVGININRDDDLSPTRP